MHILIGLLVAFVLVAVFARRGTRACRWRQSRSEGVWRCAFCGAEVASSDPSPPKVCLR